MSEHFADIIPVCPGIIQSYTDIIPVPLASIPGRLNFIRACPDIIHVYPDMHFQELSKHFASVSSNLNSIYRDYTGLTRIVTCLGE